MAEKKSAPKKRVPGKHRRRTGALWHESSTKKPTRAGKKTRAQKLENVELSRKGGKKFYGPNFRG
jgi:hypothetical protein